MVRTKCQENNRIMSWTHFGSNLIDLVNHFLLCMIGFLSIQLRSIQIMDRVNHFFILICT